MSVARERAARVEPARLMRRWAEDRFVRPSPADPRRIHAIEDRIWGRLPVEFTGVELSPVTPMGTCVAVGAADQNRIVSTMRLTEVVSDPTNPWRSRPLSGDGPANLRYIWPPAIRY